MEQNTPEVRNQWRWQNGTQGQKWHGEADGGRIKKSIGIKVMGVYVGTSWTRNKVEDMDDQRHARISSLT